jgi:hypothetical protein
MHAGARTDWFCLNELLEVGASAESNTFPYIQLC